MAEDQVVLVHPDLPDQEYETNTLHAQVLRLSGWTPKPAGDAADGEPGAAPPPRPAKATTPKES